MRDQRIDRLAEVLVRYSVGVNKGDVVLLRGPVLSEPLLTACHREVVRAGGHPILRVRIPDTEEALMRHGEDEQISYVYPCHRKDFEIANGLISVWAEDNTKAMTTVPAAKQALASQARKPLLDIMLKRSSLKGDAKFRWVGTQYPCQSSAQDAEMSLSEYEEFVFRAGLLHLSDPAKAWRKVGEAQARVCDYMNKAKELRFITGKTDLRLGIEGRKWINCDGRNNFPDGEVFTAPIESATEGEVHYSFPAVFQGQEVQGVVLRFKGGKVVDASASKGQAFLHEMLDMDKGAKTLGEVAIGTNYAITHYTKNTLFDEKIGGTFHAALGAAYPESGGRNKSALHWDMVCDLRKGGRVEVDGKVISKSGRFLNAAWPKPMGRARR